MMEIVCVCVWCVGGVVWNHMSGMKEIWLENKN